MSTLRRLGQLPLAPGGSTITLTRCLAPLQAQRWSFLHRHLGVSDTPPDAPERTRDTNRLTYIKGPAAVKPPLGTTGDEENYEQRIEEHRGRNLSFGEGLVVEIAKTARVCQLLALAAYVENGIMLESVKGSQAQRAGRQQLMAEAPGRRVPGSATMQR